MKEYPILFSGSMVKAISEDRKTQTRRVIKPPIEVHQNGNEIWLTRPKNFKDEYCRFHPYEFPYGPGDQLWVRETWRVGAWNFDTQSIAVDYLADSFVRKEWIKIDNKNQFIKLVNQSLEDAKKSGYGINRETGEVYWPKGEGPTRWRPSIHMPRWASRITLEIDEIRVERLQDITENDAKSEGVSPIFNKEYGPTGIEYRNAFMSLWNLINFKSGYGWNVNSWVKVVSFHRIEA
jgi:hypothetical protein